MEERRLILKDGKIIEGGEAGYYGGFLWLYIPAMPLSMAVALFDNPAKTGHIVFQYGEMEDAYDGYTSCMGVNIDADGRVSVCMTKGA
jgi:hypothetical protein